MRLSIFGGGPTWGFRQKTIPGRREFDILMESGSRVPGTESLAVFYIPGFDAPSRLKSGDLDKICSLLGGDLDFKHIKQWRIQDLTSEGGGAWTLSTGGG